MGDDYYNGVLLLKLADDRVAIVDVVGRATGVTVVRRGL